MAVERGIESRRQLATRGFSLSTVQTAHFTVFVVRDLLPLSIASPKNPKWVKPGWTPINPAAAGSSRALMLARYSSLVLPRQV